jgi:hypothetical protein
MQNCNPVAVPFPAKCDDILAQLATPIENPDPKLVKEFQTLCCGLPYLQVHTCPETSFVVSLLSRHMTKAGELHIAIAKKVLRYLQSLKHLHLSWSAKSCNPPHVPGEIYGWIDSSFADIKSHDNTHRVSSIGWLFMCNNGPISWRSTKTPLIALNVAEIEMITLSIDSQEAIFLCKLANELGFIQTHPTIIYEDYESAVALSKENRFCKRSKHIDVRWRFIVEKQRHDDIKVVSVNRTIMIADILCSPRTVATFSMFRNKILGYNNPPDVQKKGVSTTSSQQGIADDIAANDEPSRNNCQDTLTADFSRSFYRTHKHECTSAGTVTNLLSAYPQARTAMSPKPTTHDKTDVHSCLGNHTFEPVQES